MNTQNNQWQEKFSLIEARIRAWQSAHPFVSLTELEERIETELISIRQAILLDMVNDMEANLQSESQPMCEICGTASRTNGQKKRRLRTKDGQTIDLTREQRRCAQCGRTFFPPR